MPFNGAGVFSIVNTFVPGTTIFSSAVNANYSDIATGLSTAVLKDGTQTITANIPMAAHKFTGLAVGSSAQDSVRYDQISSIPGLVNGPGYINLARRNGGFEVWQRGAGGSASIAVAASTTAYTSDGWYLSTSANEASVVSQVAGITDGSQWAAKVLRNAGQTGTVAAIFAFPFDTDEIYPFLNQLVRLSFTAKAGANWSPALGSLTVQLRVGTGTPAKSVSGYTGQTQPIDTTQALTTTATRYQFVSSVVVPSTTRQAEITFAYAPVGTAGVDDSFTIDDVQIETVPNNTQVAAPFERLILAEQFLLCLPHFQKTFPYTTAPAQSTGRDNAELSFMQPVGAAASLAGIAWRFPSLLRKTGYTTTTYNPAASNAQPRNYTVAADCSAVAIFSTAQREQVIISATSAAGSSAGNLNAVHITVDAGI